MIQAYFMFKSIFNRKNFVRHYCDYVLYILFCRVFFLRYYIYNNLEREYNIQLRLVRFRHNRITKFKENNIYIVSYCVRQNLHSSYVIGLLWVIVIRLKLFGRSKIQFVRCEFVLNSLNCKFIFCVLTLFN